MPLARLAVLAVLVGLLVPVSGCLSCQPQLDVHRCRPEAGRCDPTQQPVIDWEPGIGDLYPDVARFIATLEEGKHGHADWTPQQADAFWQLYQVPLEQPDKRLLLRDGNSTFQVRILAC